MILMKNQTWFSCYFFLNYKDIVNGIDREITSINISISIVYNQCNIHRSMHGKDLKEQSLQKHTLVSLRTSTLDVTCVNFILIMYNALLLEFLIKASDMVNRNSQSQ